ncbi:MAG: S8 family serine peptidase [Lachnospiraceae bacterium]|nr:S8 family serine peptidase [Lachnospiraceae bacterium]
MVEVALIDNGVNNGLLMRPVKDKVTVGAFNQIEPDNLCFNEQQSIHGTNCAMIIEKYNPKVVLHSIRILADNGKGIIDKLQPALEYCYQNGIWLVNLSFGTTHFMDKTVIRHVINHYANRGMVIVAATANSGYRTYPASFSNVIGVASGLEYAIDMNLNWQIGVEFVAPSEHEISIGNYIFTLGKSNSYAAPYIMAKVGSILAENTDYNVCQIKSRMFPENYIHPVYPDWIENAWFSSACKVSRASYYFTQKKGTYESCHAQIDTIVLQNRAEYNLYGNYNKHIVYLGEELIEDRAANRHFWCKAQREIQIANSKKREADIDIPVIIFRIDKSLDDLFWLIQLRECFRNDGYNAYTISHRTESVLYDLEYIPVEVCNADKKEILHDFLYWQTYYNQSDIIIFESESEQKGTDMFVDISLVDGQVSADIYYYGHIRVKMIFTRTENINTLYHHMVELLTDESNE